MIKLKIDKNLLFIWQDLMNERSRHLALQAVGRVLLGSALSIGVPYAIGFFLNGLTNQVLDALLVGGLLFLSLELSGVALGWWRQQVREYFFQETLWFMPQSITRLYYQRPLSWLSGGTSEIDGGGVESLKAKVWNVTGSYIFQIIPGYGSVVFGLIACTYANVWLGLLALLYTIMERYNGNKVNEIIHTKMRPVIDLYKRWERRMHEWWRSTDHVKSHGVETKILHQIKDEVQTALKGDDAVWRIYFAIVIVKHRLRSLLFATLLYGVVGYLVLSSMMSLAAAVLVFFSFERIRTTLGDLNDQQRDVQFNVAGIAKYRKVLEQPVPFSYDSGKFFNEGDQTKCIDVTFKGVSHAVGDNGDRKLILRDVNLAISAGEKVGIVGPSGAGKSQFLSLLVRASDPTAGQILVNGVDLREWRLESLLRYYGVIMQKSEPFEDTVLGNLLFGVSHLDLSLNEGQPLSHREAEALCALKKAGLDASTFPDGIHTNIGYKGLKLSGGQQQRLQIAAMHFKLNLTPHRPRFIIADEPTASLDSLSELTVMEHLQDQLPKGTTLLMVAHRLSTVVNMDRIVFVRPLSVCGKETPQVTSHSSLAELYHAEALFREMADAQGFRP